MLSLCLADKTWAEPVHFYLFVGFAWGRRGQKSTNVTKIAILDRVN